ncbi:MAG: 6-phosphofructokinase, partial [Clostridia bacterium]|nr:6-phosphofructokinase [Clostridia bacterium]
MAKFRKIAVLTSGGDAPGMNAAVRAVVNSAIRRGVEVVGSKRGYSGLLENDLVPLTGKDVANIACQGGTFLYSDRCLEFKTLEGMAKALKCCADNEIDGVIAIGGDGT